MEKIKKLPDAEFDIMKVVWDNEPPVTTTFVKDQLGKKKSGRYRPLLPLCCGLLSVVSCVLKNMEKSAPISRL